MKIFNICIIIYYLFCFIYLIFALFSRERILKVIIAFLIPFFGLFFILISMIKFRKENTYLLEFSKNSNNEKYLKKTNIKEDKDTIAVMEALVLNDENIKKDVLLKIFKGSPDKYIRELKMALNDNSAETSHYASAALTEIKRKYENSIISSKIKYRETNDFQDKINYIKALKEYIDLDITDKSNKKKNMVEFCNLLSNDLLENNNNVDILLYKSLIFYNNDIKILDSYLLVEKLIDLFPDNEESYFTALEIFYYSQDTANFNKTIEIIKNSNIKLSKNKLITLRYFLGR